MSSLQELLERAHDEQIEVLQDAVQLLQIDKDELSAIMARVYVDIATNARFEPLMLIFGWGATLGYYYAMKKVGDEMLSIKREVDGA